MKYWQRTYPRGDGADGGDGRARGVRDEGELLAADEQAVHDRPERVADDERVRVVCTATALVRQKPWCSLLLLFAVCCGDEQAVHNEADQGGVICMHLTWHLFEY